MNAELHHLPFRSGEQLPARDQRDWVTSHELIDDTGISYRRLDYWTRTGLLTPLEGANPGSGFLRRYDHDQVVRACALRDLLDAGVTLPTCRLVIDDFVQLGHATVGGLTISRAEAS